MNRTRIIVGLVLAMMVALLFSTYVYRTFKRVSTVKPTFTGHLVVAYKPLPLGTRLDSSNLRLINWPADEPVPGMYQRIEDCAGRALITAVAQNEPILDSKLAPKEAGAGLPATIPEGMRGLSVAVNEVIGVAGFVTPGTMVDVLVTGVIAGTRNTGENNITRTILENVRVLAAGQKVEQDRDGKPQTVPVVTLLVSPEDADKLAMASTQGKIQLALRNTIDTKLANPAPVIQAVLFAGPTAAPVHAVEHRAAAPSRPAPYVVEVIVGTKKENKSFENQ
ncbi:MAG TPA: Flp pilus assembly protein CpaB [Candidatus Angelobacter sp.]|nr:Flp pilus assembly protein CpaB [Candidatus Angelobacter sp.]